MKRTAMAAAVSLALLLALTPLQPADALGVGDLFKPFVRSPSPPPYSSTFHAFFLLYFKRTTSS